MLVEAMTHFDDREGECRVETAMSDFGSAGKGGTPLRSDTLFLPHLWDVNGVSHRGEQRSTYVGSKQGSQHGSNARGDVQCSKRLPPTSQVIYNNE